MGQVYQYCKIQKKVVPIEEVMHDAAASTQFIIDEMPPTKHPITGEVFTSKTKFRAVTKAHGYEEVGTAYDNGFEPGERERTDTHKANIRRIKEELRERLYGR